MAFRPNEEILFNQKVSKSSSIVITNLRLIYGSKKSLEDSMIFWFRLIDDYWYEDGTFYIRAYTFRLLKRVIGERKNFMKKLNLGLNEELALKIIEILDNNLKN